MVDMSLSTLYLHELHDRQLKLNMTKGRRDYQGRDLKTTRNQGNLQELSTLSELGQEQAPLLDHQDSSYKLNRF